MSLHFQRKIGAAADIKELEYIIALHQTNARETATISSVDVHRFLRSRYALSPKAVSQNRIAELLLSLGGGEDVMSSSRPENAKSIEPQAVQNSTTESSPKLPDSSRHASNEVNGVHEKEAIADIRTGEDDAAAKDDENNNMPAKDTLEQIETVDEVIEQNKLDEEINVTPAVLQNEIPTISYCQLDMVQIVSLLLIPTFAAASIIHRDGVKPMWIPAPRGDGWYGKFLRCIDRIRAIPIRYMHASYESTLPNVHFLSEKWRLLVTGGDRDMEITEDTVRRLLLRHGEENRAKDSALIKEMVEMAQSASSRLEASTWLHVLSSDLAEWNTDNETSLSSFFQDVFGGSDPGEVFVVDSVSDVEEAERPNKEIVLEPQSAFRAFGKKRGVQVFRPERTNIDLVVDTHASSLAVILVWLFYLFGFIVYGSLLVVTIYSAEWCDMSMFSCQVSSTIVTWAVLAVLLSVAGVFVIAPMSYGNNPYKSNIFRTIASVIFSAIYGCIPLIVVRKYEDFDKDMRTIVEGDAFAAGQMITLAICVVLVALYALNLLLSLVRSFVSVRFRAIRYFLSTSNVRGEVCLKYSAARKMNRIIENARLLHRHRHRNSYVIAGEGPKSSKRDAFRSFLGQTEQYEPCGGFFWTWRRILNGELLCTEGVWINTRLIIMQVAQVVVGVFFALAVLLFVKKVADEAEAAIASLPTDTPTWVVDLFPTPEMIKRSFYPSSVLAMVAELFLILIYVPSATTTVLKYRSQALPSFRSEYFHKYRSGVDSVYMNAANGVWCMIGSAILIFLIFGILLFLFQWPYSQKVMLLILGWSIGLSVTISLKMLLTTGCRSFQYRSFFRIRPTAARISSLALECWYFGLASSTALCRVLQFLLAAALWVGRIDVNFLAEDVNFLGYSFDYVPSSFVKDLLVHEAHRHPYMERLAQMYLMKLKHPKSFGTRAGAAWRQLAVVALFPWMSQYRVLQTEIELAEDDDISMSSDNSVGVYGETQQRVQGAVDAVRQHDPREVMYKGAGHIQDMVEEVEHRIAGSRVEL